MTSIVGRMHHTRIYSDEQGESHFESKEITLSQHGMVGHLSDLFPVESMQFRENPANYDWDFHNAPQRQFIILLDATTKKR